MQKSNDHKNEPAGSEINQPLTAIANYAQACRRVLEKDPTSPKLSGSLQKISDQAIRAGDIIQKLRDFINQREIARRTR